MKNFTLLLVFIFFANLTLAQIIDIPDANFKNALINTNCVILDDDLQGDADADLNNDGEIDVNEALAVNKIDLFNQGLSTIEGIEYFTNLTLLNGHSNNLTEVDLSNLVNLETLLLELNQLESLDVTNNTQLQALQCYNNSIESLDLSQNQLLKDVYCQHNQLTEITFPSSSALELVNARNNLNLNTLDLSSLSELKYLNINDCDFNSIDLSSNLNLEGLNINRNSISSLNLTNNGLLKSLYCTDNNLSELNITNNTILWYLECSRNQINSILTNLNSDMITLICDENLITNLPLIQLPNLITLRCVGNVISQLDLTNNQDLYTLDCSENEIDNIVFSSNNELHVLNANSNEISQIDIEECPNLLSLSLDNNAINTIDVSNNLSLTSMSVSNNNLEILNVSENLSLSILVCDSNNLLELDVTQNEELLGLSVNDNPLETLLLRNGSIIANSQLLLFENTPNLNYICVDEEEVDLIASKILEYNYENVAVNTYCSFSPGGDFYEFSGSVNLDMNNDGCDNNDNFFPFFKLESDNGTEVSTIIASENGEFIKYFTDGDYTIQPILENPEYFTVSPSVVNLSFPADASPYNQDFCITSNGVYNDLEVVLIPTINAVPGFDTAYKIIYKNKGTTVLSGNINLDFEDDYMDFLSAIPAEDVETIGNLKWNFSDFQPFETREIVVSFNINTPTDPSFPLNNGDILSFNVSIDPIIGDETPNDNSFELNQTVINSYDPNDKTCLEGSEIRPNLVGEYMHYMIRFENLGTANAVNVVVKDSIDTDKFDVSTIVPLNGSHDFKTRIRDSNVVEFIFENIQLPFDDANNDGYLVFKIKTLETLVLGNAFSNQAEIYFDFNAPIITNNYSTVIQNRLSIDDFEDSVFNLYPNPVKDNITITSNVSLSNVKLIDINGRTVKTITLNNQKLETTLDVSSLISGVYFIELQSGIARETLKFIKQ